MLYSVSWPVYCSNLLVSCLRKGQEDVCDCITPEVFPSQEPIRVTAHGKMSGLTNVFARLKYLIQKAKRWCLAGGEDEHRCHLHAQMPTATVMGTSDCHRRVWYRCIPWSQLFIETCSKTDSRSIIHPLLTCFLIRKY